MRPKAFISLLIVMVLGAGTVFGAEEIRAHIGIMLDSQPLPELLVKHLRLAEGEGTRITNVVVGSAGDRAELERDDIVVGFEGKKIDGVKVLIEELKKCEIGQAAELEIIHLGQRKSVKMTLGATGGAIEWKYPWEPHEVQQWQPGRVFRLDPGQDNWIQLPLNDIWPNPNVNAQGKFDIKKFFSERYGFRYSDDGKEYNITIEGNPNDENSIITVKIGDTEYRANVKDIDGLPDEYRKSAVDAIDKAKKERGRGGLRIEVGPDGMGFSGNPTITDSPRPAPGPDSERFNLLEKQLQLLQKRLEQLERQRSSRSDEVKDNPKGSSNAVRTGIVIDKLTRT